MSDDWDDWGESKPKKKKGKKGRFKAWEDQIIKDDWQTHTDEEIAEKIGRTIKAVERRRKIMGLRKPNGRPTIENRAESIYNNPTEYNLSKLSKDDRISFYKAQFENNPRYFWLTKMLLKDEVSYYKHKYIEIIDSLDSMTMQEEDLLHNMIMKEITLIRIQTKIKEQEEIWHGADDEDERPPLNMGLYKDLNEAEKQYVSYQEKLRLTRDQRLKTDKEEKITISTMVRAFLDAKNKKHSGDLAGEMSYSTSKCKDDMTKMNFLLGG